VIGSEHHSLRILNRATKRQILFDLPYEMAQVDEIRRAFSGKLIVRGIFQIGNKEGDNVELPGGPVRHSVSAGFFWKPDSTQFLFADRLEPQNEFNLILVDIDRNGRVTVRAARQPDDPFCSVLRDPQQKLSCNVLVRKVEFYTAPESALKIWFEIVNIQQVLSGEFSLSQFK
jgi:hypothetical protein